MQAAVAPAQAPASQAEFSLPDNLRRFFRSRKPGTSGCGCH